MSDTSRRKLLKSIAAGSGAVIAGKTLPESWVKPVVDSVILPVHAQTSQFEFSQTLGYDFPQDEFVDSAPVSNEIPTQTFTFNVGSAVPTGNGQVDITNLVGDVNNSSETWEIRIGTTLLGETNTLSAALPVTAPDSQWTVQQADLQAAISGGEIDITATQSSSSIIQTNTTVNTMDVTLTFPASST